MFIILLDIIGTIAFAISGVLLAGKVRLDPFGVLVLGVVTAIGGGTLRDMMLNQGPVFWIHDPTDFIVAIITCILSLFLIRYSSYLPKLTLPILDAIGLSVFVGIGINKAFTYETGALVAVAMGVLTGVGGGIIRDVIVRQIPMILRSEIYATACIIGGSIHALCYTLLELSLDISMVVGMCLTLTIRLIAIYWRLNLPLFDLRTISLRR